MALAADQAGIQFRTLNASKGPAVRATRAQADRQLYKRAIRRCWKPSPTCEFFQQEAADLILEGERVVGVVTQSGIEFRARSRRAHRRAPFSAARSMSVSRVTPADVRATRPRIGWPPGCASCDLRVGRLKTGTPPRIDGRSIDFQDLREQHSDEPRPVFSYLGDAGDASAAAPCHITATNERTHDIIRARQRALADVHRTDRRRRPAILPLGGGQGRALRRPASHQIFIEPEGLDTHEIYPNGISTSLPFDVQYEFVRTIKGFERAHITRPGYAIEYDFFDPRDLKSSLESKFICRPVFRGTNQRHHRLRRGRGAGPPGGRQCGAVGARHATRGARSAARPTSVCWSMI